MKKKLTRRNALRTGLGVTSALLLGNRVSATQSSFLENILPVDDAGYACIVKHGRTKGNNLMVWSHMMVNNPTQLTETIQSFRNSTEYNSELKYSSNDLFKMEYANMIINHIAESPNIKFTMSVFKDYEEIFASLNPEQHQQRILNMYQELPGNDGSSVAFKKENLFGPSQQFINSMQEVNGYTMVMTNPKTDSMIQINDFISGMVFALLRQEEVTSNTKLELISSFKQALNLPDQIAITSFKNTVIKIKQGKV